MPQLRRDRLKVAAVFLVALLITFAFARTQYNTTELRTRQLELVLSSGQELSDIFKAELEHAIGLIKATTWLFYASDSVSRNEFRQFALRALDNSDLLHELQWRPRVLAQDRQRFVMEARQEGLPDFEIRDYDGAAGTFVTSSERREYFPIYFGEPAEKTLFGFDSASTEIRKKAMTEAAVIGEAIATNLLPDQKQDGEQRGIVIHVPVYRNDSAAHDDVLGFVSGIVMLEGLLNKIDKKARYLGVDFMLFDITTTTPELIYYGKGIRNGFRSDMEAYANRVAENDLRLPLDFAGRQWEFIVYSESSIFSRFTGQLYWTIFSGLGISLLLAFLASRLLREHRALTDAEERLRDLTDHLPVGVFQVLFDGAGKRRTTFVNQTAADMVGVPAETMLSSLESSFEHIVPEDLEAISASLEQSRKLRRAWEQEFRVQAAGRLHWMHARAMPREGLKGELFLNGYLEDITDRKHAEQQLIDLNEFLQQLINTIPSPVFFKGPDARFIGCNRAYEEVFGTTSASLAGKTVLELEYLPEAERLAYHAEDLRMISDGLTAHHNIPMDFADGKTHQVLYWVSGFHLSDGRAGGLVGVIVDISAQVEAHEALQDAIYQQNAIFDSAPLGIVELRNRHVLRCNARWEAMLGYGPDELTGKLSRIWFPDEESFVLMGEIAYPVLGRGETYRGEWLIQRKDDSRFWCRVSGHAIDPNDASGGSVWQFEDISEERHAAEELRKAKDMAEEATRAKSMFLANMSHEIRTPLNIIIGMAHLTMKTRLSIKQHDYLSKMHSASLSLLSIINDILDFSKIEAGRVELEHTPFVLDDMINYLSTGLAPQASERSLEILFDIHPDVPQSLVGDQLRLGQVLLNLVGNAVKFTEKGEVIVLAELLEHADNNVKLQFSVSDTGIGMTQEQVSRLFQPFTQADCSTTRKYGGTGLGLTISKRLVELMGGNIWVSSELGKGSTFYFTAWFGVDRDIPTPWIIPEELNGLHVLIVDDNAAARSVLATQMAFLPFDIEQVSSGEEALDAIKQSLPGKPFDLVLMDWSMPGMSGIEAARIIKQDLDLQKTPAIVMVTAFGREDVRREAQALNLEGFLVKPVNHSTLVDMLVSLYSPDARPEAGIHASLHGKHYSLDGVHVLIVEDNDINQQIARELLESVGASTDVAGNGAEGVDKVMSNPDGFDIVLMDLQMPEMDGFAATSAIRRDERFRDLPIVAMTAHASADDRERCLAAGMNGHVAKPIDPDVLYQTLSSLVKTGEMPQGVEKRRQDVGHAPEDMHIDGLDVAQALQRVAGNRKLYRQLLQQFATVYESHTDEIRKALLNGQRLDAQRIAHSIKGLAGNIGATELATRAGDLERIISEGGEAADTLDLFANAMTHCIANIRVWVEKVQKNEPPKKLLTQRADIGKVKNYLLALRGRMANHDARAVEFWEQHAQEFRSCIADTDLVPLESAIQQFDFEAALQQLEVVLDSLKSKKDSI
ncbi:osomolarity two-component system, sensor histidine kinase NIK1 [Methylophilaceae bacterium]|nr:osomolarity two-component system, sensor histidine kinase NIK1 [Methylophilaceae bacterium]